MPSIGRISLTHLYDAMRAASKGLFPLNAAQQSAVENDFSQSPLWVVAGPGTGKTHTLTWLVFKRILVDGIEPSRIFLTTFTTKAAEELQTRLLVTRQALIKAGLNEAKDIDLSHIMVGTLHSLASKLLDEKRYDKTLRIRVLEDEVTQQFFIRRSRNPILAVDDVKFWQYFGLLPDYATFAPNKAAKASNACKLFNRLTEGKIDSNALFADGHQHMVTLADCYDQYKADLEDKHRTDQAHLQKHLLDYLNSNEGSQWCVSGLTVIVDEYQDTNPIQEAVYFKLADASKDLTVVGDDDQSLYRFRGATVDSLLNFDHACQSYLGIAPKPVYLVENRRSHPDIVHFFDRFIANHPEMQEPGIRVRAPGKPSLTAAANVTGNYPAVAAIAAANLGKVADDTAVLVKELKEKGLIESYSQVAFLTFSTKESNRGIEKYVQALEEHEVPYYNPRNKQAHQDSLLLALVGAFSRILNPSDQLEYATRGVQDYMDSCWHALDELLLDPAYAPLSTYINECQSHLAGQALEAGKPNYLKHKGSELVTLCGVMYRLIALQPFEAALMQPLGAGRLKIINNVLTEFESLYQEGRFRVELCTSGSNVINSFDLLNFYNVFVEGISGNLSDPEEDEFAVVDNAVNIMTIHQSKGLEFEVVFVVRPDKQPYESDTHRMETLFAKFIKSPSLPASTTMRSDSMRAAEDTIRLFFVAYSRAKRLLVLSGEMSASKSAQWDRILGYAHGSKTITKKADLNKQCGMVLV